MDSDVEFRIAIFGGRELSKFDRPISRLHRHPELIERAAWTPLGIDPGEPTSGPAMVTAHHRAIRVLQSSGDRPCSARTDHPEVDFAQPDHLRRRAADEHLVRQVELIARDRLDGHLVTEVGGKMNQRGPGDPGEDVSLPRGANSPRYD